MAFETWISFLFASLLLCLTPGPTVFLVMGQSLAHGKRSALPLITGVLMGDIIAMSVSFAGLGALLATSALLFGIFKWFAAAYLIFIGIKAWRSKVTTNNVELTLHKENRKIFNAALLVTALNPKAIVFFIAFFPLFIETATPALPQMLTMAVSFLGISLVSASFYSLFSGYLRSKATSLTFQNLFNKVSGSMLIGAGSLTATLQRSN